jgi:predicted dehydrogenase/threonine dehydrogenase-like Zn-dependent dehydrogenase
MLQAIIKKGKVVAEQVPAPNVSEGGLLIKVVNSCISAGTEMSNVEGTKKSLIKLALDQPENIRLGLEMIMKSGIRRTFKNIEGVREGGKPTGYSISGIVLATGKGVNDFKVGDRVAAAGAGIANHAEFVDIPVNFAMKMPDDLGFKEASTVTLGGIAMQGVRRADMRMGEFGVVVGAGILGLLTIQMLKASGVRVIAVDIDEHRLGLAKELGAGLVINPTKEDQVKLISSYTGGFGADAVLFTAATSSSEPLSSSFKSCKRKGKVVLVGVSGMEIKRADIYAKELDFLISTSYGPGRYDNNYEGKGIDYPYSYVRWTENRNMTEFLRMMGTKQIEIEKLFDAVYPIEKVSEAFEHLNTKEPKPLMVLLEYGEIDEGAIIQLQETNKIVPIASKPIKKDKINVALVGAGSFATGIHLPNLQSLSDNYNIYSIVNRSGHKATAIGKQYEVDYVTSDIDDVLKDENVDLVMISTRHDSHANLVLRSLKAGKNTFVEKPLATNREELEAIKEFYATGSQDKPLLMTGFNRRFSKYAVEIKKHTDKRINPLFINYRMNAGHIPLDHWVHEHGGRMVGEACHIIDLMTFFTGSAIESISCESITPTTQHISGSDNKSIILKYKDGSVCTIGYFAVGNKEFPKEYMEVHFDEKTIVLNDYKSLEGFGLKLNNISSNNSEKGQKEELTELHHALTGDKTNWPIELWDMVQTTEISLMLNDI